MKFLINVKTFLRADDAMMDLLLPHVSCGYPVKGHWAVWLIPTNKVPDEVKTWLQHQPVGPGLADASALAGLSRGRIPA